MKKKLALLLAAVMVAAMVPVSAFATSSNYMTGQAVTVKSDAVLGAGNASQLAIKDNNGDIGNFTATPGNDLIFELNLTNAKWTKNAAGVDLFTIANVQSDTTGCTATSSVDVITDTSAVVTIDNTEFIGGTDTYIYIDLITTLTAAGEATVTINPVGTCPIASGTYTFAIGASGATTTAIEKTTTLSESSVQIKPITIVETAPGTLATAGTVTLKISKGFKFVVNPTTANSPSLALSYGNVTPTATGVNVLALSATGDTATFGITTLGTAVSKLVIDDIWIEAKSTAQDGDVCEITLSGASMTKQTIEVGAFAEYGYSFTVEDKALPVLYSGSWEDNDSLKVTFKETVADSWIHSRKTTFTFPTGVKVEAVNVKSPKNVTLTTTELSTATAGSFSIDKNKVTLTNPATGAANTKAEFGLVFNLSVSPEFTGDITCTIGGSSIDKDTEVIVAKAEMPFTVEVETNEVNIDYRNVAVGDIIIKEAYDGALATGDTLILAAENMTFEKGFTWEVTEGDLDIDDITIAGGNISIAIDSASAKTPGTIVISDLSLYLNRSLPAGDYNLSVVNSAPLFDVTTAFAASPDAFFNNYDSAKADPGFDVDEVVVADAYVKVVTAGRDQDDSTFTTQISVPIGAYEIACGAKTIAIDTPAFINEAGYTMMPLRGVVEALSGSAIISWDDASKTATILFGTRVISMTIGTKAMVINGTSIPMTSAPTIVNSRTFLPLRDLGYALGLSDNKIAWDDTTKTAVLN